jgi:fucose 4-O-acetylase-like acetyltransferase
MNRVVWPDAARGVGIILVVIGHALGGLIDSPLASDRIDFRNVFFAIYTFHMPLFFMLSGLFVEARVERGGGSFLKSLLPTIVWPYVLWSVVQYSVIYLLGSAVNRPAESYWPVILSLPWNTISQFWFLYALFWMHVLATLILPRTGREGLLIFGLAAKSFMLVADLPVPVRLICNNLFFYALGVWLAQGGVEALFKRMPDWVRLCMLPGAAVALITVTWSALSDYGADIPFASASSPEIANLSWRFPALAAALFALFAVLGLFQGVSQERVSWLLYLGRRTMPIFVLHILFIAGARIVLTRAGIVTEALALLIVTCLLGVAGPLIVHWVTSRLSLNRVLGLR